jgi:hypothetical protein
MKKLLYIFIMTLIFLCVALLLYGIGKKIKSNKVFKGRVDHLPEFSFTTLQGFDFCSKAISSGPLLIIHFHPECDHCQFEISELYEKIADTLHIRTILISSATMDSTVSFMSRFNYSVYKDVSVLVDSLDHFSRIFGYYSFPVHFLYDRNLRLIRILQGEYKFETLQKYFDAAKY